jgi:hypothetical protein
MTTQSHILAQNLTLPGGSIQGPEGLSTGDTLGSIINTAIPFVIAAAGIGLLVVIIGGGFTLLTSSGDTKKMEAGKQQLTNGVIGFIVIIVAYWLVQIAGNVLGIKSIGTIFN